MEDRTRGLTRGAAMDTARDTADAVAVVGGGWAGCAAAVTLANAGWKVTLLEQAATLGGRARRVAFDGLALDNGQHLLVGAYRQTLELIRAVHGPAQAAALLARLPLTLAPFGAAAIGIALRARRLPAPLHLASGIALAGGLSWHERLALVNAFRRLARAGFRCPPDQTVAECFADAPPAALAGVWSPLCLAALNTPPARASAQVFVNVLRETFTASASASDFLIPATDLSALLPDAAARHVVDRGGDVRLRTTVSAVRDDDSGVSLATHRGVERFAGAVVAVAPHQLAATVGCADGGEDDAWSPALAQLGAFDYESITTAYLAYPAAVALPAPIARLDDAPGQWVFDRSSALPQGALGGARAVLAVVISASGPHDAMPQAELVARIDAQLRRLEPGLLAPTWSRVIAERRATYACVPRLPRPAAGRIAPRIALAGDYTMAELPPTLEAATRSGVLAAEALQRDLAAR